MFEDVPLYIPAAPLQQAVQPMDWAEGGPIHNWRNYIGSRTRLVWDSLSDNAKIALAADADDRASAENWD